MPRRLALSLAVLSLACEGPAGPQGPAGAQGPTGATGPAGAGAGDAGTAPPADAGTTPGADAGTTPGADAGQSDAGGPSRGFMLSSGGLRFEIASATIAAGGRVSAVFRISDANGVPLDREGRFTEGAVAPSFVLAVLGPGPTNPGFMGPGLYTPLTTRTQTSTRTGTRLTLRQGSADSGGSFEELAAGTYRYTFGATATAATDQTYTIAAWATRMRAATRDVANAVHHFARGGRPPPETREIVTTATCNRCHGQLEAHGGARREVQLCITCHNPTSADPDTGNSVDMTEMVHKIHMGEDLPSVRMGGRYRIVGFGNAVHDYSDVVFPETFGVARCESCHDTAAAPDARVWVTHPSKRACVSCHDDIVFTQPVPPGKRLHSGGTQPDDAMCNVCHPPTGSLAGIMDVHYVGLLSPMRRRIEGRITRIGMAGPGGPITADIRVTEGGMPRDILAQPLNVLRLTVAGPNTDFAFYRQFTLQGTGASGMLTALDAANGRFRYVTAAGVPAVPGGTYTAGLEGYVQATGGPRNPLHPEVVPFSVTSSSAPPRRTVVTEARCDACHFELQAHGGTRAEAQYCTLCHNPNNPNEERAARFEDRTIFVESVAFARMIHGIHAGGFRQGDLILGGNPTPTEANPAGTPVDFGEVRFPRPLSDCQACHLPGTHRVPLPNGLLPAILQERTCREDPAADPNALCALSMWTVTATVTLAPATAACSGCHDSRDAVTHMRLETAPDGNEACGACHGTGSIADVDLVHGLR